MFYKNIRINLYNFYIANQNPNTYTKVNLILFCLSLQLKKYQYF